MDTQSYSRLLSYIACETSIPIKKHVYNFAVNDQISMNSQLLTVAAFTAKSQPQRKLKSISNNQLSLSNINMSDVVKREEEVVTEEVNYDEEELCEGTEIEKSALGDILNFDSHSMNMEQKTNCASISSNEVPPTQSVSKKRHNSPKEDVFEPDLKKSKNNESVPDSKNLNRDGLYSDPMLLCSDKDFQATYKVSRSTFEILVDILSEEELEPIENVQLYKKVMIVLWLLGSSGSYKEASQLFEISEEVVSNCFFDICATLYNKSEVFIKWPSSDETEEIASRIETNFGFPGVVGVLGCQYFPISIPKESLSRREHFNGKLRMYCVALQLVVDDEYIIRDIFPGLPGGIRPAQVLRDSQLGELLTTRATELVDPNKHILASSEFPQLPSMLTPYAKSDESLTKEEEEFNTLHGNACLIVDETFKMLKDRFRILKLLDPETAAMVLVTTCVLHNICMQNDDFYNLDKVV